MEELFFWCGECKKKMTDYEAVWDDWEEFSGHSYTEQCKCCGELLDVYNEQDQKMELENEKD